MKKILIITYYWPPSGGSGVQRWLKFVKYLTRKNYHCIVYTPENPEIPVLDTSLLKDIPTKNVEIIKTKIREPYDLYRYLTGRSHQKISVSFLNETNQKETWLEKLSKWIRGNFFIPDARMWWIKPSVHYLSKYLSKNKVDFMISTGPPHSMHLIALGIKQKFPTIKWIADFRDPWTNIDFLNDLQLTRYALQKHQTLEKQVVTTADSVITVSPTLTNELLQLDKHHAQKFHTITNGYDAEDYPASNPISSKSNIFCITYAGLIPPNRNPHNLWKSIAELSKNHQLTKPLKIKLIGKVDKSVQEDIQHNNISSFIEKMDYLPHSEVVQYIQQSDALLLIINQAPNNKGILTGKLFEYLALQKPILAIGPKDGDAAKLITETHAGIVVDYDDLEGMKNALLLLIQNKLPSPDKASILKYSREALTEDLTRILENSVS